MFLKERDPATFDDALAIAQQYVEAQGRSFATAWRKAIDKPSQYQSPATLEAPKMQKNAQSSGATIAERRNTSNAIA